jgi:hypothetical protein
MWIVLPPGASDVLEHHPRGDQPGVVRLRGHAPAQQVVLHAAVELRVGGEVLGEDVDADDLGAGQAGGGVGRLAPSADVDDLRRRGREGEAAGAVDVAVPECAGQRIGPDAVEREAQAPVEDDEALQHVCGRQRRRRRSRLGPMPSMRQPRGRRRAIARSGSRVAR